MAGVEGKLEVKVAHSAQDWRRAKEALGREHGYRPLLAESFSDPESHAGTVYTATNWTQAGTTKGFSQDHSDYYIPNGRPKKLWLKELAPRACELMSARELPEACKGALVTRGGARSPLKNAGLKSLRDALAQVPDPRHPKRLKMPGCDALNDLLAAVEPTAYARAITAWLQANAGVLPRSLALDGKSVGNGRCGMIVTLCRHEDGRPVAMIPASGKKEDCEVSEARALLSFEFYNRHPAKALNLILHARPVL